MFLYVFCYLQSIILCFVAPIFRDLWSFRHYERVTYHTIAMASRKKKICFSITNGKWPDLASISCSLTVTLALTHLFHLPSRPQLRRPAAKLLAVWLSLGRRDDAGPAGSRAPIQQRDRCLTRTLFMQIPGTVFYSPSHVHGLLHTRWNLPKHLNERWAKLYRQIPAKRINKQSCHVFTGRSVLVRMVQNLTTHVSILVGQISAAYSFPFWNSLVSYKAVLLSGEASQLQLYTFFFPPTVKKKKKNKPFFFMPHVCTHRCSCVSFPTHGR